MRIECSIVEFKGARIVVALPHSTYVRPGVGDALMLRLQPHYPGLPIVLVSTQPGTVPSYSTFDADPLLAALDVATLDLEVIDLDKPAYDDSELPF
jgi:hypothetical protein